MLYFTSFVHHGHAWCGSLNAPTSTSNEPLTRFPSYSLFVAGFAFSDPLDFTTFRVATKASEGVLKQPLDSGRSDGDSLPTAGRCCIRCDASVLAHAHGTPANCTSPDKYPQLLNSCSMCGSTHISTEHDRSAEWRRATLTRMVDGTFQ